MHCAYSEIVKTHFCFYLDFDGMQLKKKEKCYLKILEYYTGPLKTVIYNTGNVNHLRSMLIYALDTLPGILLNS